MRPPRRVGRREGAVGGPTVNQLVMGLLAPYGGDYWPGDAPQVHLTGGNVDTWTSLGGRTLTDEATATHRPAYAAPVLTFAASPQRLRGALGLLSAANEATVALQISQIGANGDICEVQNGLLAWLTGVAALGNLKWWTFTGGPYPNAETFTETGTLDNSVSHFLVLQCKWNAPLLSITKPPLKNGGAIAGVIADPGASTPTACPANVFCIGSCPANGNNICAEKVSDIVIAPKLISAPDLATLRTLIQSQPGRAF